MGKTMFWLLINSILLIRSASTLDKNALEQCIEADAFGVSDGTITDDQIIASSSILKREGKKGRLFSNSVWQAASNNYNQYLQIDLGIRRLITSVATQGYRGSGQFVIDYHITYSNDNNTYLPIVNDFNEPKVFPGNTHDDKPRFVLFDYPVVARFIRFVPRRWNINIAMRVEVYGCSYDGEAAYFDGKSAIAFDAHTPNSLYTTVDIMRFRLKTRDSEGVVFYAAGNQGDHVCLEIIDGRLFVDMSLGALTWGPSGGRGIVGSLLDDNQWHDVELTRDDKNITVSVDRVPVNITIKGEFLRLDLDRYLYLGGVPTFYQPGIKSSRNFTGCIEKFIWNGIHMTRDKDLSPRFEKIGTVGSTCLSESFLLPMTLPEPGSHIKYLSSGVTQNNLVFKLDFRTYDEGKLLVWNSAAADFEFFLYIGLQGYVEFELKQTATSFSIKEIARNDDNDGSYADGLWHSLEFKAKKDNILMTIDGKVFNTTRQLSFRAGTTFYIGGGHTEKPGFIGCLRGIYIQYETVDPQMVTCPKTAQDSPVTTCVSVQLNTCGMEDRCSPNPCEHGSLCTQTFNQFACNCTDTGYQGATCHQSLYPNSCSREIELRTRDRGTWSINIDIDGAGNLAPFPVKCRFNQVSQMVETEVEHDSMYEVLVDGKQEPGSYKRVINYATNYTQLDHVIYRAIECRQFIQYRCESSRLLDNPGVNTAPGTKVNEDGTGVDIGQPIKAYGFWVGRNNQFNYYWGGAAPETGKCACGLEGNCIEKEPNCNCDAGLDRQQVMDAGFLKHKHHLPVMELRFGDTGSLYDRKRGWHTLGALICSGDRLFDQPVTFRKADAIIFFDTFWTREIRELQTWDISFRFKTTAESGVLVNRVGRSDFIEVKLVTSTSMSFRFSAGYGIQAVTVDTAFMLNDDKWHTVYAERNRLQALLQIDEYAPVVVPHPTGVTYQVFQFTTPLIIGASVDYQDGYVGCMSSLLVNGETLDLYDKVANDPRFQYGLTKGCVGKCASNPCMNGGLCKEKYSDFICDCSYTPWRGLICGRETGVSLYSGQMLVYNPPGALKTVSENITLGFFTRINKGVLMQITDDLHNPNEYMVIEVNSGGGIRVHFKVEKERLQVNTAIPNVKLTNGQPHVIRFERSLNGKVMRLQVDDYEPITEKDLSPLFPDGADVYLTVKHILIGRNISSESIFTGCIFRAEFENHWPIKRVFQEPRPDYVNVTPSFDSVREERCGHEEILPPEEPVEIRPTYEPPVRISEAPPIEKQSAGQSAAYLGAIFSVVGVILIVIISVVIYKCRNSSAYSDTEEDELEMFDTTGADNEYYRDDYNPRSSAENYQAKTPLKEQAFL